MATPVSFGSSFLSTSPATFYTVPAGQHLLLKQVLLCNQDSTERTVDLWSVPAAGSPGDANAVLSGASVPIGTSTLDMSMVLGAGDTLRAAASVNDKVVILCSAVLVQDTLQPLPTILHRGLLPSTAGGLYTSDATTIVKHVSVCNVTDGARVFSLYVVPEGASQGDQHAIWKDQSVPARTTALISLNATLAEGDVLHGEADAGSSLAAVISGVAA